MSSGESDGMCANYDCYDQKFRMIVLLFKTVFNVWDDCAVDVVYVFSTYITRVKGIHQPVFWSLFSMQSMTSVT